MVNLEIYFVISVLHYFYIYMHGVRRVPIPFSEKVLAHRYMTSRMKYKLIVLARRYVTSRVKYSVSSQVRDVTNEM